MACTTVTVAAARPNPTNIRAVLTAVQGQAAVTWDMDILGLIKFSVDGVVKITDNYPPGQAYTLVSGLAPGSHTFCAEAA